MKANELMTGDWVLYGGEPNIITEVSEIINEEATVCFVGNNYMANIDEIKPIPLTKEILEKNFGQQRAKGGFFYHYTGSNGICDYIIEYYKDDFGFCRDHGGLLCRIKYVHELQHAFRLCKIKKEIKL